MIKTEEEESSSCLVLYHDDQEEDDVNATTSTQSQQQQQQRQLYSNLQHFGWSPLTITIAKSNNDYDDDSSPPTSQQIRDCFGSQDYDDSSWMTYRAATTESGGDTAEPKQSLELTWTNAMRMMRRRMKTTTKSNNNNNDDDDNNEQDPAVVHHDGGILIARWLQTMSQILHVVTEIGLQIPPNTLLANHTRSIDNDNNNDQQQQCLDLLRVFDYHAIVNDDTTTTTTTTPKQTILGSSPHTDWGSFTLVWQDEVGGLETYCHTCDSWVAVPATAATATGDMAATANVWNCILHVGDMTSLALQPLQKRNTITTTTTTTATTMDCIWPSPRHRVVSGSKERTSLVYFAYPPPMTITMATLRDTLQSQWKPTYQHYINENDGGGVVNNDNDNEKSSYSTSSWPYDVYSLLQDQSQEATTTSSTTTTTQTRRTPNQIYQEWQSLSIDKIVQAKWNQVQRIDSSPSSSSSE